jgi:Rieske Fe-S protein
MTVANRRTILLGVGAAGVTAAVAACSGGSDSAEPGGSESPTGGSPTGGSPTSPTPGETGGTGGALGKVSDVPVGGGVVLADQKVVLTQPAKGEVKAFTAVCTHQGCTVGDVSNGTINCPCHKSKFSAADGSVKQGPATKPLAEIKVQVEGDEIVRA